jgi:GNAT superfamily N-acetyltransferase
VARTDGRAVGCSFLELEDAPYASAQVDVVPEARRRGVGSALLAEISRDARANARDELQGEVRENDGETRAYFDRRGYRVVGAERAVALDLSTVADESIAPPDGVRIVSRAGRPDLLDGLYTVAKEALRDIPGETWDPPFDEWKAHEIDRPTRRADLWFVALAGDEVIGYAALDVFGDDGGHALTAVRRTWRRRGVATALKHAQIQAAKREGYRRLFTGSEERNLPMRSLNEKLGYKPEPSLSTLFVRGPLA